MSPTHDAGADATGPGSPPPGLHYIGGRWTPAFNGAEFPSHNPWTGAVHSTAAAGSAEDAELAVEAAHAAFPTWAVAPPAERQGILLRAADVLDRRRADIRALLLGETGCARPHADVQIDFSVSLLRQAAGLPYAPVGQLLPSDIDGTRAAAVRRPVGVVASIAPWNAPLALSARSLVGPIALGNTVVVKPSEESPVSGGTVWAEILSEAGLPPGVLNVVTHAPGEAGAIGSAFIRDPRVRRINFTGSTATGRRLAEAAGRQLKRIVLQLSGHNPLIVLADADIGYAVDAAVYGAVIHQGQVCMCARRIYVQREIADEFTSRFIAKVAALPVGDPADARTVIGPMSLFRVGTDRVTAMRWGAGANRARPSSVE